MATGELIAQRYRLAERVGAGGMGVVWRATDETATGDDARRTVALKQVQLGEWATAAERERARARLQREATIAASVPPPPPHVVALHEIVEHDGQPWLVMEYLPSRNLAEVTADGPADPRRTAHIGAQLADALAHLHRNGVLHRDVTPRNVLVGDDDVVKLADFGISRLAGTETLTGSGLPPGVPAYFAPEVAGGRKAGKKSDVFSLGATLYAAVEGIGPWGDGDALAVIRRATKGDATPSRRAGALTPVLAGMLRKHPGDRPAAARARKQLRDVADGVDTPTGPRRRAVASVGAGAAGAVLVITVLVAFGVDGRDDPDAATPDPTASATPSPTAPSLGDPHTADPCALISSRSFAPFGEPVREPDYGNFNRCDVIIESPGVQIDAEVEFIVPDAQDTPDGVTTVRNGVTVFPQSRGGDRCEQTLQLPDGTAVAITAKTSVRPPPDLCPIADIATDYALDILSRGVLPRRPPFADASLGAVKACSLLDTAALAPVPGLETATPRPDLGDWVCAWDTPDNQADVHIAFDHDMRGLISEDGQRVRVGDRDAAMLEDPDGRTCTVQILHLPAQGGRPAELVDVEVTQDAPVPQPCGPARRVAAAAVTRLPTPS